MKKFTRILCLALVAVTLCLSLIACGSDPVTNVDEAKAALREDGYVVTTDTASHIAAYAKLNVNGVTAALHAVDEDGEQAHVFFFADEAAATAAMNGIKKLSDEAKSAAGDYDWAEPAQSGTMVYYGTADGVELFK